MSQLLGIPLVGIFRILCNVLEAEFGKTQLSRYLPTPVAQQLKCLDASKDNHITFPNVAGPRQPKSMCDTSHFLAWQSSTSTSHEGTVLGDIASIDNFFNFDEFESNP